MGTCMKWGQGDVRNNEKRWGMEEVEKPADGGVHPKVQTKNNTRGPSFIVKRLFSSFWIGSLLHPVSARIVENPLSHIHYVCTCTPTLYPRRPLFLPILKTHPRPEPIPPRTGLKRQTGRRHTHSSKTHHHAILNQLPKSPHTNRVQSLITCSRGWVASTSKCTKPRSTSPSASICFWGDIRVDWSGRVSPPPSVRTYVRMG